MDIKSCDILRYCINLKGIKQEVLAKEYGFSAATISHYVSGKNSVKYDDLIGMLNHMGFDIVDVINDLRLKL